MQQPIFLEYTFLFDSASSWQHLTQFETDLADFFAAHDFQAEIVKTMNGQTGKRIMILKHVEAISKLREDAQAEDERRKQAGSKLKELSQRKLRAPAIHFMKGK